MRTYCISHVSSRGICQKHQGFVFDPKLMFPNMSFSYFSICKKCLFLTHLALHSVSHPKQIKLRYSSHSFSSVGKPLRFLSPFLAATLSHPFNHADCLSLAKRGGSRLVHAGAWGISVDVWAVHVTPSNLTSWTAHTPGTCRVWREVRQKSDRARLQCLWDVFRKTI